MRLSYVILWSNMKCQKRKYMLSHFALLKVEVSVLPDSLLLTLIKHTSILMCCVFIQTQTVD